MRSITPFLFHRWNQRCTELSSPNSFGNLFHWQPDRMRKMIPSIARRQFVLGRPVAFGGASSSKIGSMIAHISSVTSQITPSSAGFGFLPRLAIPAPPQVVPDKDRCNLFSILGKEQF